MAAQAQTKPAIRNDSRTAGPALSAPMPIRVRMPVPTMAPTPIATRCGQLRLRARLVAPGSAPRLEVGRGCASGPPIGGSCLGEVIELAGLRRMAGQYKGRGPIGR